MQNESVPYTTSGCGIEYNPGIKTEQNDVRDYVGHSIPCCLNAIFPLFGRDNNKYPLGQ